VLLLLGGHTAAAQTTQTISLEAEWNLVSLHVQPGDSSFASIFDGTVSMVKNEKGEVYLPGEEIEQISTWRTGEGYKVYAETATTLDVSGSEVPPSATVIELDEGWNVIPYLPTETRAVEKALMSIEGSLVVVEDEGGRQYDPAASSSPLDSLRPGQGYKVYVNRADTLRYPRVAQTLNDALALTDIPVGSYFRIRGYHEPGDGGGGLFRVTGSGAETDGGTVFAFNEDVSSEQSYDENGDRLRGTSVPDTDLIFGSVEVQLGQSDGQPVVGTEFLHGHNTDGWVSQSEHMPMLDHKTGDWADRTKMQSARNFWANGSGFTVRYKKATSDRRLERIGVTNAVNIDWWGAKKADPNNPVNNWWRINWAINKAAELYQNGDYEWAYVDIPGHYYYRHLIRIREGVKLRGTSNQTFGQAANGQPTHGKLTLMPGEAMNHITPGWKSENPHCAFSACALDLTHARMTSKIGLESLELDGNQDGNMTAIENPNGDFDGLGEKLQNGNQWNGFMSRPSDAWDLPSGATADFQDVYIHDFPGNGISGSWQELDFDPSENVRLEDTPRNHVLYRSAGLHDSWTIEGGGWASILKIVGGTFTDLTFNAGPNQWNKWFPSKYSNLSWNKVFDHHGKGFGGDWDNFSDRDDVKIDVDGFTIDLTDAPTHGRYSVVNLFADRGYGGSYANGTVQGPPSKPLQVVVPIGTNGNGPIRDYTYENITITDQGGGVRLMKSSPSTHNEIKNITIESDQSDTPDHVLMDIGMNSSEVYAEYNGNTIARRLGMAARVDVSEVTTQPREGQPFVVRGASSSVHPYDLFVSGSTIDNSPTDQDSRFLRERTGSNQGPFTDLFRLYLSNTAFNTRAPEPSYRSAAFHRFLLNPEKTIRLRNCTSPRTDRVSDATGTYTSTASDEGNDYVLVPTRLMSLAQEKTATVTSGNRTVQSVENADANGNILTWDPNNPQAFDPRDPYLRINLDGPIQSGNTITVDWTARVTPQADYQPTGLFVARPEAGKTYKSGGGPFTVDLRGLMASQETQAPIQYSASSDDTSVVMATVNSYQNTDDTQIPWELELTEQGTGTATITVTGTIDGVGTKTDTFEVAVE
jgi:hypothetical protein